MEIRPEEIKKVKETPLDLFFKGCKTEVTRTDYTYALKKLTCQILKNVLEGDQNLVKKQMQAPPRTKRGLKLDYYDADFEVRVNELVRRAKENREWIESLLIKLIEKFIERSKLPKSDPDHAKPSSVRQYTKAVRKLFEMNGVLISWEMIESMIPKDEYSDSSREYTLKEIRDVLPHCKIMDTVMVLLAASSGIREGGFALKWGDIFPVYQLNGKFYWEYQDVTESISKFGVVVCAIIKVYASSKDEYIGFVTPECWSVMQEYRKAWINDFGKEPKPEDPLFHTRSPFVQPLTLGGIKARMRRILQESGLRPMLPKGQKKHEVPLFNGFRRFFNKQNKKAITKNSPLAALILKENMMGHTGLIKLDKNYFKGHVDELIQEYLVAVPFLTITEDAQKQQKLDETVAQKNQAEQERDVLKHALLDVEDIKLEQMRAKARADAAEKELKELREKVAKSDR